MYMLSYMWSLYGWPYMCTHIWQPYARFVWNHIWSYDVSIYVRICGHTYMIAHIRAHICAHIWVIIYEWSYMRTYMSDHICSHIWAIIYEWSYMVTYAHIYERSYMSGHIWVHIRAQPKFTIFARVCACCNVVDICNRNILWVFVNYMHANMNVYNI